MVGRGGALPGVVVDARRPAWLLWSAGGKGRTTRSLKGESEGQARTRIPASSSVQRQSALGAGPFLVVVAVRFRCRLVPVSEIEVFACLDFLNLESMSSCRSS